MINDYATLKQAIANELARADLTTAIPNFIQLAEADFSRTLRTRFQQATVTGTISGDFVFPADYLQMVTFRIIIGGKHQELYPNPPAALAGMINAGGTPNGYVVINDTTTNGGLDGYEYVMTYLTRIPSLSDTVTQNWLIVREPGLYLYGALIHAAPYLKEDDRIATWAALAKSIMDGMQREDDNARYGNSPAMRFCSAA